MVSITKRNGYCFVIDLQKFGEDKLENEINKKSLFVLFYIFLKQNFRRKKRSYFRMTYSSPDCLSTRLIHLLFFTLSEPDPPSPAAT